MQKETYAGIILAAGSGKRMNSRTKKQYMEVWEHPLLFYSIKAFEDFGFTQIVLVTSLEDIDYCRDEIVKKYGFSHVKAIVAGGKERYDSVYEGLKQVEDSNYIFIHDGARPCVSEQILQRGLEQVKRWGACVTAVPVKDTIKVVDQEGVVTDTPERSKLWCVQTPQIFRYSIIKQAYDCMYRAQPYDVAITDDAMIVERFSDYRVRVVMGDYENIKVTTPEDLIVVKDYLSSSKSDF